MLFKYAVSWCRRDCQITEGGWKMGDLPIRSNSAGSGHVAADRSVAEAPGKAARPPAKTPVSPGHLASNKEVKTEYDHIEKVVSELSDKLRFLKDKDKGLATNPLDRAERDRDRAALAAAGKTELGPAEILSAKALMLRQEYEDAERGKPDNDDTKRALHPTAEANVAAAEAAAQAWKGLADKHQAPSAVDGAIREASATAEAELEDAKAAELKTRTVSTDR
jgi:hypothetical protein